MLILMFTSYFGIEPFIRIRTMKIPQTENHFLTYSKKKTFINNQLISGKKLFSEGGNLYLGRTYALFKCSFS